MFQNDTIFHPLWKLLTTGCHTSDLTSGPLETFSPPVQGTLSHPCVSSLPIIDNAWRAIWKHFHFKSLFSARPEGWPGRFRSINRKVNRTSFEHNLSNKLGCRAWPGGGKQNFPWPAAAPGKVGSMTANRKCRRCIFCRRDFPEWHTLARYFGKFRKIAALWDTYYC